MADAALRFAVCGVVLSVIPCLVSAQEPDPDWVRSFYNLERSHISHPPGQGLVFEAQLAPQIVVAQTLNGIFASGLVAADRGPHWGYGVVLSPMVRLRMIDEASQPVRTPSYMPHGVLQLFRVRNLGGGARESRLRRGPFETWTLQATLSHHSNGQDGCLYSSQSITLAADGSAACQFLSGLGPDPTTLNVSDGSFSTNFVRSGLFYRRLYLGGDEGPAGVDDAVGGTWYAGATVEAHRSFLVDWMPGKIPPDQQELYGSWRWRLLAGLALRDGGRLSGGHFIDVVFERYPDAADVLTKWSFSAEYIRSFERFGGWGLYARYFTGQDYYNLGFGRKLNRFSVGFAWVQERFQTLGGAALAPSR